ncbi:ADP-ribosylglycohydrolase family protein [Candidatus Woesearchaeota archaeon]|nr:ADP-ribosylglycohydrolase family protein [Candidatus Woesearchaeota archaeon]
MDDLSTINLAKGCLVGAAVGDALGMPAEYISKNELHLFYNGKIDSYQKANNNHPCAHLKPGQYTDDTQQLILLAESLVVNKSFNLLDFSQRIGQWAHDCQTIAGYDRFSGGTSMSAGLAIFNGSNPRKTGINRATCGSAMRAAPLGIFYYDNLQKLNFAAADSSLITHSHPAAIDSAIFLSKTIASLINCVNPEDSVQEAKSTLTSDLVQRLNYVFENKDKEPNLVAKEIGASESTYETVPMALHCFLHSPSDFEQTVVNAANLVPGDTDSIACIAGALSGAYNGLSSIPDKFTVTLEDYLSLSELGEKLLHLGGTSKK